MFRNTQYLSPVVNSGIIQAPRESYEYKEWYREEKRRCLNGFKVGSTEITGRHYWYLNWWKIRGVPKGGGRKTIIPPRFLDIDYEFFWEIERSIAEHNMFAKRRQVGATEKVASIIGHEFTFYPGSQSIIVAGEDKYSTNALNFVLRGLNSLSGTEFYQNRTPITGEDNGLISRYKAPAEDGGWMWKGNMSELYWFTAKNNPQVVSSKSPSLILFEECGVFPNLKKTFGYVAPSLEDQGKVISKAIFLGTGGEMDEGTTDFGDMFYNPELHHIHSQPNVYSEDPKAKPIASFIPGWKYLIIDSDGNSLKEESIAAINKERDDAMEAKDSQKLLERTIAHPLTPDEIFLIVKGNRFPQAKLNAQRANLMKHKELSAEHTLIKIDWVYDGIPQQGKPQGCVIGVKWDFAEEGDPEGVFHIFEFPDKDTIGQSKPWYFAGTDSYDKDKAPTSNSLGSTSIFNGKKLKFVARVTERPETAPQFYEMTAKLCWLYGCRNLIEWSNIRIFDWYEKMGLSHMLKERPEMAYANMINSETVNKFGVDPGTKNTWLNLYKDYMEVHSEKMTDIVQVTKALLFKEIKEYNCDITISSSLAYMHFVDEQEYIPEENEGYTNKEKAEFLYYKSAGGRIISGSTLN